MQTNTTIAGTTDHGHPVGYAAQPAQQAGTGTLNGSYSVTMVVPPAGEDFWWRLADPLRHIAGYLFTRDRASLMQVSRCLRRILEADTGTKLALAEAGQVWTMSRLLQVHDRLDRMRCSDAQRAEVLCALAPRIHHLCMDSHEAAWKIILEAAMALPNKSARAAVLVALAAIAAEFRDCRSRLARLDELANEMGAPHDIAVHVATMEALLWLEIRGWHWSYLDTWTFDLHSCLERAGLLPSVRRRDAIDIIVSFHLCRASHHRSRGGNPDKLHHPSQPASSADESSKAQTESPCEAARHDVLDAIERMADPQQRAWGLMALIKGLHLGALRWEDRGMGVASWRRALTLFMSLPPEPALETMSALAHIRAGTTMPDGADIAQTVMAFWNDTRFSGDQRSRIGAVMVGALHADQRAQAWDDLLRRCQDEGINEVRRACLAAHVDAMMSGNDSEARLRNWSGVLQMCESSALQGELAASVYALLARYLPALPDDQRPVAAGRLGERLATLQPVSLRYDSMADVLGCLPEAVRDAIARLPANCLVSLLGAGQGTPELVGRLLAAVQEEAPHGKGPALLTKAIDAAATAYVDGRLGGDTFVAFIDGLPAAMARMDLAYEPGLAAAMCRLAAMAAQHMAACPHPVHAQACRRFQAYAIASACAMPVEHRQALLMSVASGGLPSQGYRTEKASREQTAFMLAVLPSMPSIYRATVLKTWMKSRSSSGDAWSVEREVWHAIREMPSCDQAALLVACCDLFHESDRGCNIEPQERDDWLAAKAEWRAAIARLPAVDAMQINEPVYDNDDLALSSAIFGHQ